MIPSTNTIDTSQAIGVDIDNVLAASDLKIRQLIKKYFNIDSNQSDIITWEYDRSLPITASQNRFIFDLFHNRECLDVRLIPGARSSLDQLASIFQIYLLTNRPSSCMAITTAWLQKKRLRYDQLYFLSDKTILAPQLAFVIEDRLDTALAFADLGVPVYLFDYPWNRAPDQPNIIRVKGWPHLMSCLTVR